MRGGGLIRLGRLEAEVEPFVPPPSEGVVVLVGADDDEPTDLPLGSVVVRLTFPIEPVAGSPDAIAHPRRFDLSRLADEDLDRLAVAAGLDPGPEPRRFEIGKSRAEPGMADARGGETREISPPEVAGRAGPDLGAYGAPAPSPVPPRSGRVERRPLTGKEWLSQKSRPRRDSIQHLIFTEYDN